MKYRLLLLPCVLVVGQLQAQTVATGTPNTVAPATAATVASPAVAPPAVFSTGGNQPVSPSQSTISGSSTQNSSGIPGAGSLFPTAATPAPVRPAPNVNPVLANPGGLPSVTSVTNLNGVTNAVVGALQITNSVSSISTNTYGGGGGFVTGNSPSYGVASGTGFTLTNGVLLGNNGVILNQNAGAALPADWITPGGLSQQTNILRHVPRSLGTPPLR